MAHDVSSIDDLLETGKTLSQPQAPEHEPEIDNDEAPENTESKPEFSKEVSRETYEEESDSSDEQLPDSDSNDSDNTEDDSYDEYGNEKPEPKMYTQDEVNEMFRKRFKNKSPEEQQAAMQHVQQQVNDNFQVDQNSDQDWEQQLAQFVEKTVQNMTQKQMQQQQQAKEKAAQQEFEAKFHEGMGRFTDFVEVVSQQQVTDPMTYALRGMKDPAAFIYAASKRHASELQRISQLADPYSQMVEMGKLEERMRKSKQASKAPKPVSRTREDANIPGEQKKKELSIEDKIAEAEQRKLAKMRARYKQ